MICYGFNDSTKRNKHYKQHVKGIGGGTNWKPDMPDWYTDALAYEAAAIAFATMPGTFHAVNFPIVELITNKGNMARWNQNTGLFVAATSEGTLLTYHIRGDASLFQSAILEF